MKKILSYLAAILVALLTACGGGEADVPKVATAVVAAPVATLSVAVPTDEISMAATSDDVAVSTPAPVVAPTTAEILASLKVPSGSFVDSDTNETVSVAPGQTYVTLTSFSMTKTFRENFGVMHQPITQLVFLNRTDTNIWSMLNPWDIKLKYGYQDMYPTVEYYVEAWKTDKGSGVMVTFFNGWYGQVPYTGIVGPFQLETTSISPFATKGMSLELELIHVQTGNVQADYELDSEQSRRTLVVDPAYIPPGKG